MNRNSRKAYDVFNYSKNAIYVIAGLVLLNGKISAQTTSLAVVDSRNVVSTPDSYSRSVTVNFRTSVMAGLPEVGTPYLTTLGLRGWSDNTGGKAHELAFSDDYNIFFRSGHSAWEAWRRLVIADQNNKVSLGTTSIPAQLNVSGFILLPGITNNNVNRPVLSANRINGEIAGYSTRGTTADEGFLRLSAGGGTNTFGKTYIDISGYSVVPEFDRNIVLGTSGLERLRVLSNGNVGIGTSSPKEALSVNGNVRARQVVVETTNWPDYVFEEDYNLISLSELKKYIKEHGHLPEIPSVGEVSRNGVNLGELVKVQTKKIEELTLYMIEKDEEVGRIKKELEELKRLLIKR